MASGKRKFYKIRGLHTIFKVYEDGTVEEPKYIYNTGINGFVDDLEDVGIKDIDKHTILFITATEEDEQKYVRTVFGEQDDSSLNLFGKEYDFGNEEILEELKYTDRLVHKGDTMIWARGDVYSISTQCVSKIVFDEDRNIIVTNTDGTTQTISQEESGLGYEGVFPIIVDGTQVKLEGISIDDKNNIIEIPEDGENNRIYSGINYSHVSGKSNTATNSYQNIIGKYSLPDNSAIFIIGGGTEDERFNLFTVSFDGVAHVLEDITIGSDKNNPECKLSDIHSVVDDDWIFIGQ